MPFRRIFKKSWKQWKLGQNLDNFEMVPNLRQASNMPSGQPELDIYIKFLAPVRNTGKSTVENLVRVYLEPELEI